MALALFTLDGESSVHPTGFSRGPWSPDALHGGPVAAIMARAAERALHRTGSDAVDPVRFTVDLERPVPLAPLRIEAEVVRGGRKVQIAEVRLFDDQGRRIARATVLAIRRIAAELPGGLLLPSDPLPPDRATAPAAPMWAGPGDLDAFHKDGVEHRFVGPTSGMLELGPGTTWVRLVVPVVTGEVPSPLQRAVAAADFTNGISGVLPVDAWTFVNPDLTVTLHRLPVGEWVAVDAVTRVDASGVGTAEADLFDERGRIGHCVQTLLIDPR